MKNKDIHEWLLDEELDPSTTIGGCFLSDILEKHLTEYIAALRESEDSRAPIMYFLSWTGDPNPRSSKDYKRFYDEVEYAAKHSGNWEEVLDASVVIDKTSENFNPRFRQCIAASDLKTLAVKFANVVFWNKHPWHKGWVRP